MKLIALWLTAWLLLPDLALAIACAGGDAGKQRYNGGIMEYCNGSNWTSMKGASAGACAAGDAGKARYSSAKFQFCDGSNWYDMKGSSVAGCAAGDAGKQRYSSNQMQFCNGSNWYDMTAPPPTVWVNQGTSTWYADCAGFSGFASGAPCSVPGQYCTNLSGDRMDYRCQ